MLILILFHSIISHSCSNEEILCHKTNYNYHPFLIAFNPTGLSFKYNYLIFLENYENCLT